MRSLTEQTLMSYLATEQARRSAQLSLVANVASAYLTWRADQELLALTAKTLVADEESLRLTSRSAEAGKVSALDVSQARTSVETARANLARYQRQVAQDLNNLTLLVGTQVADSLPARPLASDLIAQVPAGLPSDLLQRRPDILQAEYQLKAANANIGAARAAFFPSVSLTTNAGTSSLNWPGCSRAAPAAGPSSRRSTCRSSMPAACGPASTTPSCRRTSASRSTKSRSRPPSRKSPTASPRARPTAISSTPSAAWWKPPRTITGWRNTATAPEWTATWCSSTRNARCSARNRG